jgi:cysteine dioxygenase
VRIVDGAATETLYREVGPGLVAPARTRQLERGSVCVTSDRDIHLIQNLGAGQDLVTLHLYSPPLQMNYYDLANDLQS